MAKKQPGVRDGTGPYEESYRRRVEGKSTGRRIERGETCPSKKKDKIDGIKFW